MNNNKGKNIAPYAEGPVGEVGQGRTGPRQVGGVSRLTKR